MDNVFEDLVVVKRSGQRVNFNSLKIVVAIKAAFDSLGSYTELDANKVYKDTLNYIKDNYTDRKTISVEDIQDIIEKTLQEDGYEDVYKSFSMYRLRRAESRKAFSIKQQHKFVKAIEKIGEYQNKDSDELSSFEALATTVSEEYNKSYLLDHKCVRAHDEGRIYIEHMPYFNLGYLNETNLIVDNLFEEEGNFLDLYSVITNSSKEVTSEIGISDFDIILDRYIINRYKKELKDALTCYFTLNGFLPFINMKRITENINRIEKLEFEIPEELEVSEPLMNTIKYIDESIVEKVKEEVAASINSLFINLDNEIKTYNLSIGNGSLGTVNLILDVLDNLSDLKKVNIIYKLSNEISKETVERLTKLILNEKNIYLSKKEYSFSNGLLLDNKGTSNISMISINVARLWYKYNSLSQEFYEELDDTLELSKNTLIYLFETIGDKLKDNYHYLFNNNIKDDEKLETGQKIRKVIKIGTLDFNLIGLKECGEPLEIVKHISEKINTYRSESLYNYKLSALNNESSSYMLELDKAIYGSKINIKDKYSDIATGSKPDFNLLKEYSEYLDGGFKTSIELSKNPSTKQITNLINEINNSNLGLVKINIRGVL